ncbi:MAG TPA: twin-arginine translocation signal domain-containing protein, partial [Flavitalea sp.]|nr:twin-arginine translocation signal domain-containing protein [Flavitalea sp.]
MQRRNFLKNTTLLGGGFAIAGHSVLGNVTAPGIFVPEEPWFGRSLRWAQLAFVENDPGRYDPDFWLSYFKRIHADGVLLSAGGIVAFYPTDVPLHHRSNTLGTSNPLGYMVEG